MKKSVKMFLRNSCNTGRYTKAGFLALAFMLCGQLVLAQQPKISSLSKQSGSINEIITINGSGFGNKNDLQLRFGTALAEISESNSSMIKAKVPAGATFGPVSVLHRSSGKSGRSTTPFSPAFGGSTFSADKLTGPTDFASNTSLNDLQLADLDGDGLSDVITSHRAVDKISIYQNTSSGLSDISFSKTDLTVGGYTNNIITGDLDGDGKPDLAITGQEAYKDKIFFLRNTSSSGNIQFDGTVQTLPLNPAGAGRLELQDLNEDGLPELIMSNIDNNKVYIFLNQSSPGQLKFTQSDVVLEHDGGRGFGLTIADLNGDNKSEIIVSAYLGTNIFIFPNQSSGGTISFGTPHTLFTTSGNLSVMAGDLDNDGKTDLALTNMHNNYFAAWINKTETGGELAFGSMHRFTTEFRPFGLQLSDIDGDGYTDAVIGHTHSGALVVMRNTSTPGTPLFSKEVISGLEKNQNVRAGDVDGDGKPEIVYTSIESNKLSVLRNEICVTAKLKPEGSREFCEGTPFKLETYQGAGLSYEWKQNGNTISGANSHSLDVTQSGTYTVTITENGLPCSSTSAAVEVNVIAGTALAEAQILPPDPVCEGQTIKLQTETVTGATYHWSGPNNFSKTTNSPSVSLDNASQQMKGTYSLQIEVGPCMTNPVSQFVDVLSLPEPQISYNGSTSVCAGEPLSLSLSGSYQSYQWKKDGQPIAGATTSTYQTQQVGSYSVEVSNAGDCSIESQAVVLSRGEAPEAGFQAPDIACLNQEISFTNTSVAEVNQEVVYAWNFGDGNTSNAKNPTHYYSRTQAEPYTVSLKIRYQGGSCEDIFKREIMVQESTDQVDLLAPNGTDFCQGESLQLQLNGDVTSASWSNGASGMEILVTEAGTYTAQVQTLSGCVVSRSITLNPASGPELAISADKTLIQAGEAAQLQATGGLRYEWAPAEGLDNPEIANPLARPLATTTYTVTAYNEAGCATSAEITIELDEQVYVEANNIFIPTRESFWKIKNIENYPNLTLYILNRLGKIVYSATPYQNYWDGRQGGQLLNEGVYFYVLKNPEGKPVKTGNITIVH